MSRYQRSKYEHTDSESEWDSAEEEAPRTRGRRPREEDEERLVGRQKLLSRSKSDVSDFPRSL